MEKYKITSKLRAKDAPNVLLTTLIISMLLHIFGQFEWSIASVLFYAFVSGLMAYASNLLIHSIVKVIVHRSRNL